ncbi:ligase-associated DNA damage response endonuclease PdeM [Algirhabdus cladophorae]|uniref:ligase-associated DNA damage response endonuclease PdeM n=1 Tax=Algirhabdus cladophorae TaxID=3377108 RepID=UPI003B84B324
MNGCVFQFSGHSLTALGSGALWWADRRVLCVSDLHLGKSDRLARRGGLMLPPYETHDTLARLENAIEATNPKTVLCLGDSFDDRAAALSLTQDECLWIARLQAGRRWLWVEGNHDPGPLDFAGSFMAEVSIAGLAFRHIAQAGAAAEVSGHYHPKVQIKAGGRALSRPAFLFNASQLIMPAFGTYTGGLRSSDPALQQILGADMQAILLGTPPRHVPNLAL